MHQTLKLDTFQVEERYVVFTVDELTNQQHISPTRIPTSTSTRIFCPEQNVGTN